MPTAAASPPPPAAPAETDGSAKDTVAGSAGADEAELLEDATTAEEAPAAALVGDEESGDSDRPRRPQSGPAPLNAGERNDNDAFADYLAYLDSYQDIPAVAIDVRERYLITAINDQQIPLLDAQVRIYDGDSDRQVFEARATASGATIFHPAAHGVSPNTTSFRIVAESNGASAETTIARSDGQQAVELVVNGGVPPEELRLDVLFLLDTTGSMADELFRIQETIDSIAQRIDGFTPRPTLRFAVVAYRDHGDDYETRAYDFTGDVEAFRGMLNSFDADGGGDTPEDLNQGLHQAIHDMDWSDGAVRLIFLVADAGPHLDYDQGYTYATDLPNALARGIKIYPIAASNTDPYAEYVFRQLAQQTLGSFIFLTYQAGESSGAPGESTELEAGDQPYTVEHLDDLIVGIVQRELSSTSSGN